MRTQKCLHNAYFSAENLKLHWSYQLTLITFLAEYLQIRWETVNTTKSAPLRSWTTMQCWQIVILYSPILLGQLVWHRDINYSEHGVRGHSWMATTQALSHLLWIVFFQSYILPSSWVVLSSQWWYNSSSLAAVPRVTTPITNCLWGSGSGSGLSLPKVMAVLVVSDTFFHCGLVYLSHTIYLCGVPKFARFPHK